MYTAPVHIRMVQASEVDELVAHLARQLRNDADLPRPVSPHGRQRIDFDTDAARRKRVQAWTRSAGTPGWGRAWAAWADDCIVGHGELQAGPLPSESHRATLGLAVEESARRRGAATSIMSQMIAWCRNQPEVAWIDLGVFEDNDVARHLYQSLGFVEVGRVKDRFRVDGAFITDISMALSVAPAL